MEVVMSRYAGFCPGVRRAVRLAEETLEKHPGNVYSMGPIIHNPRVVDDLMRKGLRILPEDDSSLRDFDLRGARVIVRSHGIPPARAELLEEKGAQLVDATCPTVKKAQRAAMRLVGEGYRLFIIGNADHPEVAAILGHVNNEAVVIKGSGELKEWWQGQKRAVRKVGLIAQTTVDLLTFRSLVDGLINEVPELIREVLELKIINTLCRNTLARQAEALQLALASDFVVVVGGRNSSNTEFLRKMCEATGRGTLKVESADDIDPRLLEGVERLAILGGTSTPRESLEEVQRKLTA